MTYGLIALGAVRGGRYCCYYIWLGWDVYWLWLLAVNVVTFVFYRYDKRRARAGWMRVPEVVLLFHSRWVASSAQDLGMYIRPRHKVKKPKFVLALVAGAVIQAGILYFLYLR